MDNNIKELEFSKSYNKEWNCFTGRYDGRFLTGSDATGKFLIGNFKDFNSITIISLQKEIEDRFKSI